MELDNYIKILNCEYKMVQLNKHWPYFMNANNQRETELLEKISNNLSRNVIIDDNIKLNSINEYDVMNMNFDKMKDVIKTFFVKINPELSDKVDFIFSKTIGIEKSKNNGRSVTNNNGIIIYYKNNELVSLVEFAHEISHAIASISKNIDGKFIINDKNKEQQLSEIESLLTEDLFLEYLIDENKFNIYKKDDASVLTKEDLKSIKYNKLRNTMNHVYRVYDELNFQRFMSKNGYKDITIDVINDYCKENNIDDAMKGCSKINLILSHYCPKENLNYVPQSGYDLKNGEHLSNECRFIYAYCFLEKFNNMNLSFEEKKKFYNNYLENVKNMSFEDVGKMFGISKPLSISISEDFISNYNSISEDYYINHKHI